VAVARLADTLSTVVEDSIATEEGRGVVQGI
jgi:hypothetical protein